MGNCTHKPNINKKNLKLQTKYQVNNKIKSDSDIFEDVTPDRKPQNLTIIPKKSQFKLKPVKQNLEEPLPSNITKSSENQMEKTTSSRQNIYDNYKMIKLIGKGSFGKVRLATNVNGKEFAVKSILKADAGERYYLLRRELDIMKKVDHPNLVKFYETYHDDKYLHIVMEFVQGKELSQYCQERFEVNRKFTESEVAFIVRKLLSALSHMHNLGIIHRDIKLENIMINESNLDVKILDFGLSRDFSQSQASILQSIVGTPLYVAPEVINEQPYDQKSDSWSMGVLMYYLISGSHPFEASNIKELFKNICSANFNFRSSAWSGISKSAKVLITQFLNLDPKSRISCEEALQSDWFSVYLKNQINYKSRNMKKCLSKIQNFISFQNSFKFKQEIIRLMFNTQTQTDEIQKLKIAFETIDTDDNGYISAEELFKATQQLNIPITQKQIYALFQEINCHKINNAFKISQEIDVNQDENKQQNYIHYSDFIYASINLSKELDQEKINQLFSHFDKDGDNFISPQDLEDTFAQEGRKLPEQSIRQMIEEVDVDGDGKISQQEFLQLVQQEIEIFQKTRTSFTNLEI
ncbi:kinase domain protein (macronuclear) [Tetrahymena thermophila SB210]|uniref:non-specific serine/threonine protein kinase n=1 Tax=Tetrahymena thermophila (strain SB210) TaxID=312017 RepID=I7LTM8_TETTS|nr:kinase domain protein [Tetrahymena thermophila SB210]EAR85533.1 kinase domain protein [Tetrahymena thermophila SB210]|eukprot:XP_001033196.1 kinase domain protein [Tetrahymena thermophila SB210]